jgi:hypothetical protein
MMFLNAKYVVVSYRENAYLEKIFPFDNSIQHSAMFEILKSAGFDSVVSAGFIDEFMQCYGSSTSLRANSRPAEDTKLLKSMFSIDDKEIIFDSEDR